MYTALLWSGVRRRTERNHKVCLWYSICVDRLNLEKEREWLIREFLSDNVIWGIVKWIVVFLSVEISHAKVCWMQKIWQMLWMDMVCKRRPSECGIWFKRKKIYSVGWYLWIVSEHSSNWVSWFCMKHISCIEVLQICVAFIYKYQHQKNEYATISSMCGYFTTHQKGSECDCSASLMSTPAKYTLDACMCLSHIGELYDAMGSVLYL